MARAQVEIHGLKRLRRTMKAAGRDMTELKKANKEAADTVKSAASPRTPHRTGALQRSLRTSGTQSAGIVRAGKKAVPYAGPVHWGWPARNIAAQPWLVDAAKETEPVWTQKYLAFVNDLLDQVEGL